jgi:hypothetical protein
MSGHHPPTIPTHSPARRVQLPAPSPPAERLPPTSLQPPHGAPAARAGSSSSTLQPRQAPSLPSMQMPTVQPVAPHRSTVGSGTPGSAAGHRHHASGPSGSGGPPSHVAQGPTSEPTPQGPAPGEGGIGGSSSQLPPPRGKRPHRSGRHRPPPGGYSRHPDAVEARERRDRRTPEQVQKDFDRREASDKRYQQKKKRGESRGEQEPPPDGGASSTARS